MPFNYNPNDYKPNYGFIAQGAATIGQGIGTAVDTKIAYQRELDKAAKIAEKNRNLVDTSYKAVKNVALRKIQKLQELGVISNDEAGQREVSLMLKTIPRPGEFENVRDYISLADKTSSELFDDLDRKLAEAEAKNKQIGIGTEVMGAIKGTPERTPQPDMQMQSGSKVLPENPENPWGDNDTPPELAKPVTIPAKPPATSTMDLAMNLPPERTQQELETNPAYVAMREREKQAMKEKELKIKEDRLDLDKNKAGRLANNQALGWARLNLDSKKFEYVMGTKIGKDVDLASRAVAEADVVLAKYEGEGAKILENKTALEQQLQSDIVKTDPEQSQNIKKELDKLKAEERNNDRLVASYREKKLRAEREENNATKVFEDYVKSLPEMKNVSEYSGSVGAAEEEKNKPVMSGPRPIQTPAPNAAPQPSAPAPAPAPVQQSPAPTPIPVQQPPARTVTSLDVPNATGKPIQGSTQNDVRTMSDADVEKMIAAKVAEWKTKTNNKALIEENVKKLRKRIADARATAQKGK